MTKMRIIRILAPTIVLSVATYFVISSLYTRPRIYRTLLGDKANCDILSNHPIDQDRCYHNALIAGFEGYMASSLETIEDLCENGHARSCFARDQFNNLHNSTGINIQSANLNNDIKHCLIKIRDYSFNNYYCNRLYNWAKLINVKSMKLVLK